VSGEFVCEFDSQAKIEELIVLVSHIFSNGLDEQLPPESQVTVGRLCAQHVVVPYHWDCFGVVTLRHFLKTICMSWYCFG